MVITSRKEGGCPLGGINGRFPGSGLPGFNIENLLSYFSYTPVFPISTEIYDDDDNDFKYKVILGGIDHEL